MEKNQRGYLIAHGHDDVRIAAYRVANDEIGPSLHPDPEEAQHFLHFPSNAAELAKYEDRDHRRVREGERYGGEPVS